MTSPCPFCSRTDHEVVETVLGRITVCPDAPNQIHSFPSTWPDASDTSNDALYRHILRLEARVCEMERRLAVIAKSCTCLPGDPPCARCGGAD